MNLTEFKAWFEGFTENLDGPPGPKGWERICARVKEITPEPTPWPQFVREYVPYYPTWPYWQYPKWTSTSIGATNTSTISKNYVVEGSNRAVDLNLNVNNSVDTPAPLMAFTDLGRLDAQDIYTLST